MIGATAKAQQFMTRSGNESTKGSRKGFSLLGGGEDPASVLSEHDRLRNMRAAGHNEIVALNTELTRLTAIVRKEARFKQPAFFNALEARDKVKIELTEKLAQQREIVAQLRSIAAPLRVERLFVDAAKDMLTLAQFKTIMAEANRRLTAAQNKDKP